MRTDLSYRRDDGVEERGDKGWGGSLGNSSLRFGMTKAENVSRTTYDDS